MSYGTEPTEQNLEAASYVDRILRGAKPAELPVQAPTKYETVFNLKTAKALGLTVPGRLLVAAPRTLNGFNHDSVSTFRSSNRTCRSPASGSRTRLHTFIHGASCPSRHDLMGWYLSAKRRERRQASIQSVAQGPLPGSR
jgi:hypothetical protein